MKRSSLNITLVITSLLIVGCMLRIPGWYKNPPEDPNFIFGTAEATSSQMQLAVDKAGQAARFNIAQGMEDHFSGLSKRFTEETEVSGDYDLLDYFVQGSKSVVDVTLIGVTEVKKVIRKTSKGYRAFILLKMGLGSANRLLLIELQSNEARWTQFKATKFFQELDEETQKLLEKESEEAEEFQQ